MEVAIVDLSNHGKDMGTLVNMDLGLSIDPHLLKIKFQNEK